MLIFAGIEIQYRNNSLNSPDTLYLITLSSSSAIIFFLRVLLLIISKILQLMLLIRYSANGLPIFINTAFIRDVVNKYLPATRAQKLIDLSFNDLY